MTTTRGVTRTLTSVGQRRSRRTSASGLASRFDVATRFSTRFGRLARRGSPGDGARGYGGLFVR